MRIAASREVALRDNLGLVLMLSLLWLSPARASELSQVPTALASGFDLPDLAGRPRSLSEFEGKVVLVTFWASWCRPCIEEMPSIRRLADAMADAPFAVVGVNVGEGERRVQSAARRLGITFPVLLDRNSATFKAWSADVLPTAYVLDAGGKVRYLARGPLEWDRTDIIERLRRLAAEEAPRAE